MDPRRKRKHVWVKVADEAPTEAVKIFAEQHPEYRDSLIAKDQVKPHEMKSTDSMRSFADTESDLKSQFASVKSQINEVWRQAALINLCSIYFSLENHHFLRPPKILFRKNLWTEGISRDKRACR